VKVFEGHPQQMGNELDAIKKGEAHAEMEFDAFNEGDAMLAHIKV